MNHDNLSSYEELLEKYESVSHSRNKGSTAVETFTIKSNLSRGMISDVFLRLKKSAVQSSLNLDFWSTSLTSLS